MTPGPIDPRTDRGRISLISAVARSISRRSWHRENINMKLRVKIIHIMIIIIIISIVLFCAVARRRWRYFREQAESYAIIQRCRTGDAALMEQHAVSDKAYAESQQALAGAILAGLKKPYDAKHRYNYMKALLIGESATRVLEKARLWHEEADRCEREAARAAQLRKHYLSRWW